MKLSRDVCLKQHKAYHDHYKECYEAMSQIVKPSQLLPWAVQRL